MSTILYKKFSDINKSLYLHFIFMHSLYNYDINV